MQGRCRQIFDYRQAKSSEKFGEVATTTEHIRRVGWLDLEIVRTAVELSGVTEICLTKLDILSGLEKKFRSMSITNWTESSSAMRMWMPMVWMKWSASIKPSPAGSEDIEQGTVTFRSYHETPRDM